jgi:hypothetical protein
MDTFNALNLSQICNDDRLRYRLRSKRLDKSGCKLRPPRAMCDLLTPSGEFEYQR